MKKVALLPFFLFIGCANSYYFVELEHISSLQEGKPFNDNPETSADILFTGYRYRNINGIYIDVGVGYETSNDLEGTNPYGKIKVGKEWSAK